MKLRVPKGKRNQFHSASEVRESLGVKVPMSRNMEINIVPNVNNMRVGGGGATENS